MDAKKIGHSFYGFSRKRDHFHQLNELAHIEDGMNINQIKNLLRASLISKNEKEFEKILQCLNDNEKMLFANNENDIVGYFSTNMKEMKWKKGQRLFNAFVASLND